MVTSLVTSLPLILVIMSAGVDGQQYWAVNYGPSYVCALKGSTVKMFCVLNHPHDYKLTTAFWTKPAVTDGDPPNLCSDPEKRGRVQCVSEYKDTYSITLTSVTEADKHIYYCRFTTDRGTWTGIPGARLDITDLQVETQKSVKEGDSVRLMCKSSCSLPQQTTFIWYRNTQRLTTGIITVNQLQLQSVSRHDAGNYRCAVSGYERLKSPPVYLKVGRVDGQQHWGVNYSPSYVCALKGSTVNMACTLKYPHYHQLTTVFWTKPAVTDGDPPNLCLDPEKSGRVQCVSDYKDTYRITLTSVTEADKHIYYCRFTTDRGTWTGIPGARLDVTASGEIVEGDSVTLSCSSDSNPPALNFSWFKENQSSAVGSGQSFSISSFNSSHSGRYYCEAQNKHGSQRSASVSVSVKGVQRAALHTVIGIVVGCGGLIIIIIIIIIISVFIKKKRRDCGADVVRQNQQDDRVGRSAETAPTNDVPVYSLVSANQRDDLYANIKAKKPKRSGREQTEKDSGGAEEIQYVSVHHFKNKDMNKTEETTEMQHLSDDNRSEDVIYSSVN
ncbi:sialoadhesin-like [Sinocyclocheilus rhinocerous]|uniref:sialoadhesin-like n=1 Tax=Sinocyclocheilus rhinocerous TaxID=307959 RepID=UPI0007B7DB5B|nr:PREDICTED: sialoadhesin-like [Sinocyclocheilus rhinocerous]